MGFLQKCYLVNNGIDHLERQAFAAFFDEELRGRSRTIAFVGGWHVRKGRRSWPQIIRQIRLEHSEIRFRLIGTGALEREVLSELDPRDVNSVSVVSRYGPAELPSLLSDAHLGLFPSYVEGFPLGVLEMLAAGLPVIGWNAPGQREMLGQFRESMMVPIGDVEGTAQHVINFLKIPINVYHSICREGMKIAAQYQWEGIAEQVEKLFLAGLDRFPTKAGVVARPHLNA